MGDDAAIAEAKHDANAASAKAASAPLQLMTQFLRTVSENRMEDALALAQTILKFEPNNAIILDYQGTLAQYINNEREIEAARDEGEEENSTGESSTDTEDVVSGEANATDNAGSWACSPISKQSTHVSNNTNLLNRQKKPAGDTTCPHLDITTTTCGHHVNEEEDLQRLGGMFRDLRERRAAASGESACRWDEHKFAASRR
ncbi:unnamed protein product [Laminaria digitata]